MTLISYGLKLPRVCSGPQAWGIPSGLGKKMTNTTEHDVLDERITHVDTSTATLCHPSAAHIPHSVSTVQYRYRLTMPATNSQQRYCR